MAARVSGSSSTRMTRTGEAGVGDAGREAAGAGTVEGSGTGTSLGARADTITIPTAQAPGLFRPVNCAPAGISRLGPCRAGR